MSDDTLKIKRKLSVLINSLDDLETGLAALLPELVLSLDTLQQAKLQVVIPYLVYDLVFVYLKTRGLDPKTHPVIAELDRVRQYFDKIKDAEDPVKRQLAIDRAAATRFIKHAIAQAKDTTPGNDIGSGPTTHLRFEANEATHAVHVPVKATTKMLEREQYRETLREEPSEEGSNDLAVIDSDESEDADGSFGSPGQVSGFKAGKGKAKSMRSSARDVSTSTSETWAEKRRRPPIDPFSGYSEGQDVCSSSLTGSMPSTSRSGARARGICIEDGRADVSSGTTPSSGGEQQDRTKSRKRPKKKGPF